MGKLTYEFDKEEMNNLTKCFTTGKVSKMISTTLDKFWFMLPKKMINNLLSNLAKIKLGNNQILHLDDLSLKKENNLFILTTYAINDKTIKKFYHLERD